MPEYRAYIIRPDGHIHYRVDLACNDEADAKEQPKALVDGFDVELWELDKLIERFKGANSPA
jgi:predicted nucleotidyltransferase